MSDIGIEAATPELELARAEALHYKMLFVSGVAHYARFLPEDEKQAIAGIIVNAMRAVNTDWLKRYGYTAVPDIVLEELKKVGDGG